MLGWLAAAAPPLIYICFCAEEGKFPGRPCSICWLRRKNSRRIRIENWILLAVRKALI